MKEILGLDLGTTSIGWAHIREGENKNEIVQVGVRVNPLSTDEQTNFIKGKPITINAERTLKRGARRTLDRYQDRRSNLINALYKANIITKETKLAEVGKNSTFNTYKLRAKAVNEKIEKDELARVFLAINKKRGYKSSRKTKVEDESQAIDSMEIAKKLYEENITPGELVLQLLENGKKHLPDFYRSDLQNEFDRIWDFQKVFHPTILTDEFKKAVTGKGAKATSALFWINYQFNTAENKAKTRDEKKLQAYKWRCDALKTELAKEEVAYVLTEINNNLNKSSGYLGAISDRSKEIYFNKITVGQYLYNQLNNNSHTKLKNQVFYRQDYLDEFEAIWREQEKHHHELTSELKEEIRDIIIFYQRKLKSQKRLISLCEFEKKEIEIIKNGIKTKKTIGSKVIPKSSPLFQEFKIWQRLNDLILTPKNSKKNVSKDNQQDKFVLDIEAKQRLFDELNIKGKLSSAKAIEILGHKNSEWEFNFAVLEGNLTNQALFNAYLKILEIEGYNEDLLKLSDKDEINIAELKTPALEIKEMIFKIFELIGIDTNILTFDPLLDGQEFEQQASYRLWHLLYSTEDDSKYYSDEERLIYGNENIGLKKLLCTKFGFKPEHAKILINVSLVSDYGSLSTKAIRNIYPYIKENNYSTSCELAKYRHSSMSLTAEEIANRPLKDKLELLKKNSLRNPVVEKILNQVVNVVNTLIENNSKKDTNGNIIQYFKFDEIRIELARELKKNASERSEMTLNIYASKLIHDKIFKILQNEFGIKNPTRNDIIRYKLYEELKNNGYKDLYTNTYIPREILFSKEIDIEHIIPQSKLFDDSFSNKTIVYRKDNLKKGNQTAYDYINNEFGAENLIAYEQRIEFLYNEGKKNKEEGISKAKYQKLRKKDSDIDDGFIDRDLRDSQYIAKKAKNMLYEISRNVLSTSGSITDKLRDDWGLINIMQELNFEKFKKLGLTEKIEKKDGTFKERIVDWTKRNDHRHHAMDAITVAFTKHSHIQYLNYLNARKNEKHKFHNIIKAIENSETELITDSEGNRKRIFKAPFSNFRVIAREHLDNLLVSHKAKNKVVTKNKNITKKKNGKNIKVELTPRGQLHKETVYGKYHYYESKEEKIGAKFDLETINKIANPKIKDLLLQRLVENGNDPKKAFTGKNAIANNPIYIDSNKTIKVPEKVKLIWLEEDYSIRKDISPDNFKDEKSIEKVIDQGIKRLLLSRLKEHNNDPKKAFVDLEKNPIWLNKEKGVSIKRVTISGVKNAEPLHFKKDHFGNSILDNNGQRIPVDFVSTSNNHHVAIYIDEKGNLQERIVSLFEATQLVNASEPVIDKLYNQNIGWKFLFTMKQNEYFVFPNEKTGFDPKNIDLLDPKNNKEISPNLFRVQKIASKNYFFRHHLETTLNDKIELKGITYKPQLGLSSISGIIKVRLNHLGEIVKIGEY